MVEKKINEILKKMTLKEKIGQLNQVSFASDPDILKEKIRKGEVGSLILCGTPWAGKATGEKIPLEFLDECQKIAVEESPNHIPLIFGRDVIHGFDVILPIPLGHTASFNSELTEKAYRYVAQSAAAAGVHWTFAPMLDCSRDPRWGRMVEGPGEDPYLGKEVAKAIVKGFQGDDLSDRNSIVACAKHYIGYGASEGGRDYYHTEITDYTLRNYYLPAFKGAVEAGVKTVMSSFNEIGGQPVTSSKYLLNDVLKDELGFEGYVVSDWNSVEQLMTQGVAKDKKEACKLALNAGLDMDMVSDAYIKYIEECFENGEISLETLDEAVRRVLRVKMECGLFDTPFERPKKPNLDEYMKTAFELSAESMVLLKNKSNVLPISKDKKIALIGPMKNEKNSLLGTWTLDPDLNLVKSFKEAFEEVFGKENVFTRNTTLSDDDKLAVFNADVIVVALGESSAMTGENSSVASIELSTSQQELVKFAHSTGKPVVILMAFGRPMAIQSIEHYADAILYTWHSGTNTAVATAEILSGKICPSGHLPVTFPATTGQIPVYYNSPSAARDYVNGYYKDCQLFNYYDVYGQKMYPFGFGLSYTEFEYNNFKILNSEMSLKEIENGEKFKVSVDVKNVGNYDGKATVQIYIRDLYATMSRPLKELKGFEKIFLKKNETKTVEFELGFDELAFYDANKEFVVEKGEFEVYVGNDCMTELKSIINVF